MTDLNRPAVEEVYSMLSEFNGLIVHFSAAYNLSGKDLCDLKNFYPDDLKYVIEGGAQGGVSASIVMPGDEIGFELEYSKAVGSIGVILGLKNPNSIVEVNEKDCGSSYDDSGFRTVGNPRKNITVDELQRTIEDRVNYNEWVIRDFDVLGILALPPYEIKVRKVLDDPTVSDGNNVTHSLGHTSKSDVFRNFNYYSLYTFMQNNLNKIVEDKDELLPVEHSAIYTLE